MGGMNKEKKNELIVLFECGECSAIRQNSHTNMRSGTETNTQHEKDCIRKIEENNMFFLGFFPLLITNCIAC